MSAAAAQKKYVYQDTTVEADAPQEEIVDEEDEYDVIARPDTFLFQTSFALPPDSINALKNTKGFEYRHYLDSLLKDESKKAKERKTQERSGPGFIESILRSGIVTILFWVLGIGFICFILYRIFLTQGAFKKPSKKVKTEVPELAEAELDADTDYERLVIQALQQHNYRLAVRYRYLQSLQLLAAGGRVELAADKTNYEYVRSIKDATLQKDFAAVTLGYEYVWYGEFNIDEAVYRRLDNNFTAFKQKI